MDETNLQILTLLQDNARISNSEIGRKLGLVPSAILERLRKLEEQGHIKGYQTRVNPESVNLGLLAFIFVRSSEPIGDQSTAHALKELPEILEIHNVAGEDCYMLKVRTANTQALANFVRDKLRLIGTITSTRSTIVLETVKETSTLPIKE